MNKKNKSEKPQRCIATDNEIAKLNDPATSDKYRREIRYRIRCRIERLEEEIERLRGLEEDRDLAEEAGRKAHYAQMPRPSYDTLEMLENRHRAVGEEGDE